MYFSCTFAEVIQDEKSKRKIIIQEIIKPSSPVKNPMFCLCSRPGKWSAQTGTETWWDPGKFLSRLGVRWAQQLIE